MSTNNTRIYVLSNIGYRPQDVWLKAIEEIETREANASDSDTRIDSDSKTLYNSPNFKVTSDFRSIADTQSNPRISPKPTKPLIVVMGDYITKYGFTENLEAIDYLDQKFGPTNVVLIRGPNEYNLSRLSDKAFFKMLEKTFKSEMGDAFKTPGFNPVEFLKHRFAISKKSIYRFQNNDFFFSYGGVNVNLDLPKQRFDELINPMENLRDPLVQERISGMGKTIIFNSWIEGMDRGRLNQGPGYICTDIRSSNPKDDSNVVLPSLVCITNSRVDNLDVVLF